MKRHSISGPSRSDNRLGRGRSKPRSFVSGRKAAAALRYKMGQDKAPRLVAKGAGVVAEKILRAAQEAGVPIHEDPDLLALLMTLDIGELIPPELYMAVAEVLAFIYRMNNKKIMA